MQSHLRAALFALGLFFVAAFHFLLGALFLLAASASSPHRLIVGLFAIGLAGIAAWAGRLQWQRSKTLQPAHLRQEILALAQKNDGVVESTAIEATFGPRSVEAHAEIQRMSAEALCRLSNEDRAVRFLFDSLIPRIAMRHCPFCQAELPLDSTLVVCPQCGGTLQTGSLQLSSEKGEFYDMDT